jgi:hypothetical protein
MLRSDHSAFLSPLVSALQSRLALVGFAAFAFAAGCSPKIGDKCTVSTDCSATGDRLCDITEPGGYCTIFNCEPDGCPDDAACINFGTTLSVGDPGAIIPGCTASQGNSPYQRSFCLASCKTDGDCRAGYSCLEPALVGGEKADYNRSNKVCAVQLSSVLPVADGGNNEVCLGSDAGEEPNMSTGGGAAIDAGTGAATSGSGGMSGADNAGAGG